MLLEIIKNGLTYHDFGSVVAYRGLLKLELFFELLCLLQQDVDCEYKNQKSQDLKS